MESPVTAFGLWSVWQVLSIINKALLLLCFRRFRASRLRKSRVPWDVEKFWMRHANIGVTDKYTEQLKDDVAYRQRWAKKIGLGFVVPRVPQLRQ